MSGGELAAARKPAVSAVAHPVLQRALVGHACSQCSDGAAPRLEDELLQRKARDGDRTPPTVPAIVHEVLRSPGQPLDAATRTFMEPRLGSDFAALPAHANATPTVPARLSIGAPQDEFEQQAERTAERIVNRPAPSASGAYDLGGVRIHTDDKAAQSAQAVNALAYTVGRDVVFGAGQFAPESHEGRRLIAHELTHVLQAPGQNAALRRQPDPKGPHTQPGEARLRARIVDAFKTTKDTAVDAVIAAIERGDRAYLENLGLTSKQVDHLLNGTRQFEMMFGTAAELGVERAVRADPFLSQYVKRGPVGRVPRGVGKPDWRIETPSSSIPVDLMTPQQVEEKLEMWRKQWKRGKPKWYIEKGLNVTYDRPGTLRPGGTPQTELPVAATSETAGEEIAQGISRISRFKSAGRFLAREIPGLVGQLVVMLLFPPKVYIHNDRADELSRTILDPAVQTALKQQEVAFYKVLDADPSKLIYANVKVKLIYRATGDGGGNLHLTLDDVQFLDMKIANEPADQQDRKFDATGTKPTKQITYSVLIYEPEAVVQERQRQEEAARADREYQEWLHAQPNYKKWLQAQQEYEKCVQQYGTGRIPPAAGAEAASDFNPDEAPCIPPRMEPMEGP